MSGIIKVSKGPNTELGPALRIHGAEVVKRNSLYMVDRTWGLSPTPLFYCSARSSIKPHQIIAYNPDEIDPKKYAMAREDGIKNFIMSLPDISTMVVSNPEETARVLNEKINQILNLRVFINKLKRAMDAHRDYELDLKLLGEDKKAQSIQHKIGLVEVWTLDRAAICNGKDWFKFDFKSCLR